MNLHESQGGFTLLEMVVALALSALVALIGVMALRTGADFYTRSELRLKNHANLRAAERSLRVEWASRIGNVQLTADSVEFDTATPVSNEIPPGRARVRYSCQHNGDIGFTLLHETMPIDDGEKEGTFSGKASGIPMSDLGKVNPKTAELLNALKGCKISALSRRASPTSGTIPVWLDTWNVKDMSPQLIRLKIVSASGELPHIVFVAQRL